MIFLASIFILYFSLTICGLRLSVELSNVPSLLLLSRFMPNTFTDLSDECAREGKVGRFLDMANPALYIRLHIICCSHLINNSSDR